MWSVGRAAVLCVAALEAVMFHRHIAYGGALATWGRQTVMGNVSDLLGSDGNSPFVVGFHICNSTCKRDGE